MSKKELECYVEHECDIIRIIVWTTEDYEFGEIAVKDVTNNDLWDSITTPEDLYDTFGELYWDTLEDYKKDNSKLFADWLEEQG